VITAYLEKRAKIQSSCTTSYYPDFDRRDWRMPR